MTIAERLFNGDSAKWDLEDILDGLGVPTEEDLGWDYYDYSLEIHKAPSDYRLSVEAQRAIHDAGFSKVYVNHVDKWETHYTFPAGEFVAQEGWRVSYPHKRGDGQKGILVESQPESWPSEWFETGYASVVK
jgi:hypothetical protein